MSIYLIVFIAALFTGLISLIGGVILLWRKFSDNSLRLLVSFAAGALLAAAFLDLLPEAAHEYNIEQVLIYTLLGILIFFLAEKFLLWHHHSHNHCTTESHHSGKLIIWGDVLHNFIDGPIIAIAFLTDFKLGIITTIAIMLHEIPQEIGDFAVMLQAGISRAKVLFYNILSSLATVVGAMLALFFSGFISQVSPLLLGLASGAFIYIAAADLIPNIHRETNTRLMYLQTLCLIFGILVIGGLVHFLE